MGTWSFLDVKAGITGPGGAFSLGSDTEVSEEAISVEPTGDKNIMTIGASGAGMHNLRADKSGTITVRLLRTSPRNAQLQALYNYQTAAGKTHGKNTITITNKETGEIITATKVAFAKESARTFAVEGGVLEWIFHAIKVTGFIFPSEAS